MNARARQLRMLVAATIAVLPVGGCAAYDHFEVQIVDAPYGGEANADAVYVPLGALLTVDVRAVSTGRLVIPGYLRSTDRNVMEIRAASGGDPQRFVLLGASPGTVFLEFVAENNVQSTITALVYE